MTINWYPHPADPETILASVDGVNRGYVRRDSWGWYGRSDYHPDPVRPMDDTEASARVLVEDRIRLVLAGA